MDRTDRLDRMNRNEMNAAPKDLLALVLIGASGSGKSTVGIGLASALGAVFLEGDSFHPPGNIAKMRAGIALDDADRAPWLEKLGQAIAEQTQAGYSIVAACSALRRSYREALGRAAGRPLTFFHLTVEPTILASRVEARQQHFMPPSLLQSQLEAFEPLQADEDGTEIRENGTAREAVAQVQRWLTHHERGK